MERKTSEQTDIEWIKSSLKRIEVRLIDLESFKWKVIGISSAVMFLIAAAIEVLHGK